MASVELHYKLLNALDNMAWAGKDSGTDFDKQAQKIYEADYWAPKMDCDMNPSSPYGFRMRGGTIAECFEKIEERLNAWGFLFESQTPVDYSASEDGRIIIVYEVDDTMRDGQKGKLPMFTRYEFNDSGQIDKVLMMLNPHLIYPSAPQEQELLSTTAAPRGFLSLSVAFGLGFALAAFTLKSRLSVKPEPLLG